MRRTALSHCLFALFPVVLLPGLVRGSEVVPPISARFSAATVEETPSFQGHILPLMGKLGCNGRACHGSFQGQGGFRLSLFGYDFKMDHDALLKSETPRVDLETPDASLILEKPTLTLPHKGGKRMDLASWEYRVFLRWIEAGARGVDENDRRFERLEIVPSRIVFARVGEKAPLRALAHWSDGTCEDVTPLCRFRTNNDALAEVTESGVVEAKTAGDTHIVAFYDNGVAPVEVVLPVSEFVGVRYPEVPAPTRIDALVVDKLRTLGVIPSDLADDAEFLRRVSLDMTGTLPEPAEIEAFLADSSGEKRARKIDELLDRPTYAAWWATRLCDITGDSPRNFDEQNVQFQQARQWYLWIYRRLRENVAYDKLAAGIVLAVSRKPGQTYDEYMADMATYYRQDNPADFTEREQLPLYWSRKTFRDPPERALGFAHTFLGLRLQCAQCHKHPFDQWTQEDFKQFSSFFARVTFGTQRDSAQRVKELREELGKDRKKQQEIVAQGGLFPWREVFIAPPGAQPGNRGKQRPQPEIAMIAKLLGGETVKLEQDRDPREILMEWMRRPDNPYFAKAFVNRVWAAYFGVGIIEPPDDLNLANPPSNAPLLDDLARRFIEHQFDMKWLHREIANSRTYQLSWKPNATNQLDLRNFSHALPRRLPAEVAYDAINQATATLDDIHSAASDPTGRSIAQADAFGKARRGRNNNYALTVFGTSPRSTNCDCDRSSEPSLLQTIYLRNDQEMLASISRSGWLQLVAQQIHPRGPATRNPQARNAQARNGQTDDPAAQIARVEARLKTLQAEGKTDQATQAEKRLRNLKEQVARRPAAEIPRDGVAEKPAETRPAAAAPAEPAAAPELLDQFVREAYLRTLSRPPTEIEATRSREHLLAAADPVAGLSDLLWALLNTKEFIVNH